MYSPILSSPPPGDTTSVLSVMATAFRPLTPLFASEPPAFLATAEAAADAGGSEEVDAKLDECAAPWMAAFGAAGATKAALIGWRRVEPCRVVSCCAKERNGMAGKGGTAAGGDDAFVVLVDNSLVYV